MPNAVLPSESANQRPTKLATFIQTINAMTSSRSGAPLINDVYASDLEAVNGNYEEYLRSMIASLLENQMTLSSALDETREACTQLNLEKSELISANQYETPSLQAELSLCRRREADLLLAYDELRHRVESLDSIIEQIPWLDTIFNSPDALPLRLKALKSDDLVTREVSTSFDNTTPHHLSPVQNSFPSWADLPTSTKSEPLGYDSPHSDSGCTSECHYELSLASLTSPHSSPFLCQPTRTETCSAIVHYAQDDNDVEPLRPCRRSQSILLGRGGKSEGTEAVELRRGNGSVLRQQISTPITPTNNHATEKQPTSAFGRITDSLRKSITKFADKSEWKMEALVARKREARTMLLLNETQAELRKIESRCCGLKRQLEQQEARMAVKEKEVERLVDVERQLRRELRNWQQRVFQLESETQEVKRNSQITELEMKSRLLEAEMRMAHVEQTLQQNATSNDILHLLGTSQSLETTPSSLRRQVGGGGVVCSTRSNSAFTGITPTEDVSKPPRSEGLRSFNSLKVSRRPHFSSVSVLNMINSPTRSEEENRLSRPISTLHLDEFKLPVSSLENASFHSKSFGSLSELKLRVDV